MSQDRDSKPIDTTTKMIWIDACFGYQFPFGNLADIFKSNFTLGIGLNYKTASNWTWSAHFDYKFGSNLKNYEISFLQSLFGDVINSHNDIIDAWGRATTVYFEGRYFSINAGFGKIFALDRWRNSGLWLHGDLGYINHKIYINIPDPSSNRILQFEGDYKKLYDRRSSGFYMSQFFGYLFMHKVRVASFYAGVEVAEMWTKFNRSYAFNVEPEQMSIYKFSLFLGVKIGWVIPLHEKKKVVKYYYN
ncbi:MAG: hypothetical protein LBU51_08250 [Bacteroidales bacterium]|jgi:hypothetical protein|nr:hypothetical protein [Bacteroidales bacterium]